MNEYDDATRTATDREETLVGYARLVRVPNLFTAPPDVLLGAALVAVAGGAVESRQLAGLAVASVLLYAAGTTLNDYVDAPEDARHRPERPIPSGEVSRSRALALGGGCLVAGVAVAFAAGGVVSGAVAAVLAVLVAGYDLAFKDTVVGFLLMGSARGTNVLLGVTIAGTLTGLDGWRAAVPLVVAAYVACVTFMAESESGELDAGAVEFGVGGTVLAALAAAAFLAVGAGRSAEAAVGAVLVGGFLVWNGRALSAAYADPSPETIGPAVGTCVLGLVVFDAVVANAAGLGWGAATLAFLLPAVGLASVVDVS